MGSAFGKMDPNATNDVDSQGNVVATGMSGARTVADPNQGLTAGQMFTRKALSGAFSGAGQGLQRQAGMTPGMGVKAQPGAMQMLPQPNYLQQAQQQGSQAAASSQPPVPPQNTGMNPVGGAGINGNNSPFPKGPRPSLFYGAPGGF